MAPLQVCQRHIGAVPLIRLFIHPGLHTVRPGIGNVGAGDDGLSERKLGMGSDDGVTLFDRTLALSPPPPPFSSHQMFLR